MALHVGILAFPFGTHAAPLLAVVQRLASAAPETLFSFFSSRQSIDAISAERVAEQYENVRVWQVWDGAPAAGLHGGSHAEAVGMFLRASPGNFEKAIEEAEEGTGMRIECFMSDAFLWFCSDMAEQRKVPWLSFWTAASCSLSVHVYTDDIVRNVEATDIAKRQNTLSFSPPGFPKLHLNDLPPEIFIDKKNPSPIATTIYNMVGKLHKSTAVVLNCFEEIDPIITQDMKSKFMDFLNIGPSILSSPPSPNPDDKTGCLSWLESQSARSVVYVSFGTVIIPPDDELLALAEALEAFNVPFLWSLKDHAKKLLPEQFLQRTDLGKIVPWAPQLHVLGHRNVGVFITHCGWNSVLESISSSIPMICRPFFGDQKLNAKMVEESWKIGVRVEGGVFTKSGAIEALNRVMVNDEGKKIRENVCILNEKATNAVEKDGSSTKNFKRLLEVIRSGSKVHT